MYLCVSLVILNIFFFKKKTAYEMRISDWSSDVCSSDLTNAAFELVAEFAAPTVAIIKHANPCGVASRDTLAAAYAEALACDPVSAFGGIIAVNCPLDAATAAAVAGLFAGVVIATAENGKTLGRERVVTYGANLGGG